MIGGCMRFNICWPIGCDVSGAGWIRNFALLDGVRENEIATEAARVHNREQEPVCFVFRNGAGDWIIIG